MPDDGIFAPLPEAKRAAKRVAPKDPWRPTLPVPSDAPPAPDRHPRHGKPSRCWIYRDAAGQPLGQIWRFDLAAGGKEFAPVTFCENAATGARAWRFKAWSVPRPLYGLDRLAQHPSAPVVVCEGEKAADAAAELLPDHVAVTSPNGANSAAKADWRALAGRNVIVWPDNDEEGCTYAAAVARAFCGIAASVRVASAPAGAPEKWDAADALAEGWDHSKASALIAAGVPVAGDDVTTADPANDDAEIARLAALTPLQYEREREAAAKRLGCRTTILDRLVAGTRGTSVAAGQGQPLDLHQPEPWPDPIDCASLVDALTAAIRRHVVLGAAEADAAGLWALAVHAFDAFSIFPRLFVTAPEKGCGKSTLLDVLSHLVPRPLGASNIRAAALFRTIEAARPTFLLDEADAYARDNEDLRSALDGGHSRKGFVIRCVGEDHEPRRFSIWAPVALAAIGHLPGTVEDRSIKIAMRRRRPDECVEQLRDGRTQHLEKLASMAARWAVDHTAPLAEADPVMPAGIINRAADNWRPLLAVADIAGGAWPERARRAAIELSADGEDAMSAGVLLLADLRELFVSQPSGALFTREILKALHADETRPWPEWKNGKPITERQLAALVKPYKIRPKTVRRGAETEKGYRFDWFADAFASYLPPRSVTASQSSIRAALDSDPSVTGPAPVARDVTDHRSQKSRVSAPCDGVTDLKTGPDDDEFGERAAILEYDGGHQRAEAERLARAEIARTIPTRRDENDTEGGEIGSSSRTRVCAILRT
jgi:putative DNA primase/helicase